MQTQEISMSDLKMAKPLCILFSNELSDVEEYRIYNSNGVVMTLYNHETGKETIVNYDENIWTLLMRLILGAHTVDDYELMESIISCAMKIARTKREKKMIKWFLDVYDST